ncbi:MAG: endolytic transglycosylase MltG [Candidatus Sungbacteria bacterium]|uniref:Endolytic murein transglycosylase n=1 Tax=Candidatus Sungiibacteriota bacterium TaxID=2750080 RepID=A0A9D6QU35_9BACT|nr:endolytic transglycosylase MltG [Candidatus Sungbacteria bacterium]
MESEFGHPKTPPRAPLFWFWVITSAMGVILMLGFGWLVYEVYLPHTSFFGEKKIVIPASYGSRLIGDLLKQGGFIGSKWAFVTYATFKNQASSLKPGTYSFSENSTMIEILHNLVVGEPYANERFVVIPEGWNLGDIGHYLETENIVASKEFWRVAGYPAKDYTFALASSRPEDFSRDFPFLVGKNNGTGLEGYLFPDTYRVYRNATAEDIAKKMLANFKTKVIGAYGDEVLGQNKKLADIITVASLVEKEVRQDNDRAVVAGILWKRLSAGLPLQVDASLIYIRGVSGAPITARDKESLSRFNTYRYPGLPLGPISNPGISAITAALHPNNSPYLYYLSAPDGTTIFSKTLAEHNAAKAKFLGK